jgi:hypothetical protein
MSQPSKQATTSSSKGAASPSIGDLATEILETAIPYKSVRDLFHRAYEELEADCIAFKQVSSKDFDRIEKSRDRREMPGFRLFYLADHMLLIVTIPTRQHVRIHGYLDDSVVDQLRGRNITRDEWISSGSQTFDSKRPGASGSGQGDSTRMTESRAERNGWPTLVIEVGHTLPLNGLRLKMRWWFLASNHDVKIVLLAKLDRHLRMIRLEKWRERPYHHRTGTTVTRAAAAPSAADPYLDQWVEIQMAPGITETDPARLNWASYVVAGDGLRPLRLEFNALLERQPGPGQGDILFTVQDMQRLAVPVWASVN